MSGGKAFSKMGPAKSSVEETGMKEVTVGRGGPVQVAQDFSLINIAAKGV